MATPWVKGKAPDFGAMSQNEASCLRFKRGKSLCERVHRENIPDLPCSVWSQYDLPERLIFEPFSGGSSLRLYSGNVRIFLIHGKDNPSGVTEASWRSSSQSSQELSIF
jgi:hypothetical protein